MKLQKIAFPVCLCVIGVCLSVPVGSCRKAPEAKSASESTLEQSSSVSLGSLHGKKVIVRLEPGSKFSILDAEGDPIALSLSKSDFQGRFPKLFEEFEKALAGADGQEVIIDASMD